MSAIFWGFIEGPGEDMLGVGLVTVILLRLVTLMADTLLRLKTLIPFKLLLLSKKVYK